MFEPALAPPIHEPYQSFKSGALRAGFIGPNAAGLTAAGVINTLPLSKVCTVAVSISHEKLEE